MANAMDEQLSILLSIIELSDDAIIAGTVDGIIRMWNPAAEKLYGYSSEEMIGKPAALIVPEDQMAESTDNWTKAINGERIEHWETFRVRKDGTTVAVSISISSVWDADGKNIGVYAIARDASETKRAYEYARILIEASLDPLITISLEGKITDVNEAAIRVSGVGRKEIIGTNFSDYFIEPENVFEIYRRVLTDGVVTDISLTIRHRDGTLTDVVCNASVYRDDSGKVLGVVATGRDVTEQKRAQAAVVKQQIMERQRLVENDRLVELERFQRLTVGRELKMIEMKKEIEKLRRLIPVESGEPIDEH